MSQYPSPVRHLRTSIPGHKDSFALIATPQADPVERAVVFVHGFNGSAGGTWTDFISLIDSMANRTWWEQSDVYFFDYHWASVFRQVGRNTTTLLGFLDDIFPNPPMELFSTPEVKLREQCEYKELMLVGHSEGGLLLRKAIVATAGDDDRLEAYRIDPARATKPEPAPEGIEVAELRLFAPAIGGEALTGFKGIVASTFARFLHVSAAKTSMASPSSPVVTAREHTEHYANFLQLPCFRAHILWADDDDVVLSEKYLHDKTCRNVRPGTDHVSVCKPSLLYLLPVHFVEKGVVNGKCN